MRGIRFWMIKQTLKAFWQRTWRIDGLADMDMWNVDHYLATKIAPALRRFVEVERHGVPTSVLDEPKHDDVDWYVPIWEAILWKMVDGFERMIKCDCFQLDMDSYEEEALELFCEFYFNLWD